MSKRNKAPDIQIRSGVLSCFNYKKKTLLQKEAYELSPMYWKCFIHGPHRIVVLHGHRSEMSTKDKPRVNMVINGCTTELLPPILKAKGKDYPGNDNYLGIQTADDKIVFLKAEGRSQRDLWYTDIMEALGDRASISTSTGADAPRSFVSQGRSPSQKQPSMSSLDDKVDNDNNTANAQELTSDVYHFPYQDYEQMRCSTSTEEDESSWSGAKPSSSTTTGQASSIISDVDKGESFTSSNEIDDDGYIFPTHLSKKSIDIQPEAKPVALHMLPDDRPAITPDFLESLKQAQESKPRHFDMSPDRPRYTGVPRKTKPPPTAHAPEALPNSSKVKPLPNMPNERKASISETTSPEESAHVSSAKTPSVKAVSTKPWVSDPTSKTARKPLKMPPPLPAGGNAKPKPTSGFSDRPEGLPQLPPLPQSKVRPNPVEAVLSSPETSAIKEHSSEVNEEVYQLVRSIRSTQMSHDTKSIQVAMETLQEEDCLKFASIKDEVYVGSFGDVLSTSGLLIGDQVLMINNQAITSANEAVKCVEATDGDLVTLSVKKIPHGVLSYISRSQKVSVDLSKLGLSLNGNEVTKFDSDGLVTRSGIPSRQMVPGITNNGELVTWALTQINMIPVSASVTNAQVEDILLESGNTVALVFHPADFAAALTQ